MTEEAFLAEIRASPEDDVPRLVFADWLEDHGDPARAEFIRAQVQMARMNWREPGYSELKERSRKRLVEHHKDWLAGYPPELLTAHRGPAFRRGFPEEV